MRKKFLGIIAVVSLFLGIGMGFVPAAVFAKDLDLSMVIPGDIILGRAPTADHANDTYYTHAALVIDKNTTIESLGKGYYVNIYPISNWKTLFQRSYYQKVVVLRVKNISDYHRTAAINKAKEQWGKPYSWKYPYVKFPNPGYHYCSSLVWHAYKWGTWIDLDCDGGYWILPDDIFLDNDVTILSMQSN